MVTYSFYLNRFNTHFNLGFGRPKTDTCAQCDQLSVQIEDASDPTHLLDQLVEHRRTASQFYSRLNEDTDLAKSSDHIATLTFDYQQNLPLPHITCSDVFYCRQLWLHVFGLHNCATGNARMCVYLESVAKKGANEVVSLLHHYFASLPPQVTDLCLYSDGCSGQNKNIIMIEYLFTLVRMGKFNKITHTFPIRGHSYLPNDRDFAKTETRKRKSGHIFTPEQWIEIIQTAKEKKPFEVVPVDQSMIYDFKCHLSTFFKKTLTTQSRQKLRFRDARVFEYSVNHQDEVWVKYSYTDDSQWSKFPILKPRAPSVLTLPVTPMYLQPIPLKSAKVADLQKLLKYIPQEFQPIYIQLTGSEEAQSSSDSGDD